MDLREWIASDHGGVLTRFDNAIGAHVPTERWRPGAGVDGPSIAWLLFHMTYHQDLALQTGIQARPPLLATQRNALGLGGCAPSAGLSEAEDRDVSSAIDLVALREYAATVNAATARWIATAALDQLDVTPPLSARLHDAAAIPSGDAMQWLHSMWQGKTVAWLIQWECIGHGHGHVGEMVGTRNRLGYSPF